VPQSYRHGSSQGFRGASLSSAVAACRDSTVQLSSTCVAKSWFPPCDDVVKLRGRSRLGADSQGKGGKAETSRRTQARAGWPAEDQAQSAALGPVRRPRMRGAPSPIDIGSFAAAHAVARRYPRSGQANVRWGHGRS